MDVTRLNAMVNDIASYFASEADRDVAIAGIVNHILRSWEPRMRRQIIAQTNETAASLSELARAAVKSLAAQSVIP